MAAALSGRRQDLFDRDLSRVAERARARSDNADFEQLAQGLLDDCHPKQRAAVEDPGKRIVIRCGGRAGKTTGARARLMRQCLLVPKSDCLFVATSAGQAKELMWAPLKELVKKTGLDVKWGEADLSMQLRRNGSKLRLVGADDKRQIERLRGVPRHLVIIDEASSYKAQLLNWLIYRVLGARLGDFDGCLVLQGTPGHIFAGPFYDHTCPGSKTSRPYAERDRPEFKGWDGWSFHYWHAGDPEAHAVAPRIKKAWENLLREKRRNGWSDDHPVFRREALGEWAADDTESVFQYSVSRNQWDPPRDNPHRIAELPKDRDDWEWVLGMDLGGAADPVALSGWAFSPTDPGKRLLQVWEHEQKGLYARSIAGILLGTDAETGEVRSPDRPGGVIGRLGWPTRAVADRDGSGDAVLRELSQVYGVPFEPAQKRNYYDNVELFNGDLVDGRAKVLKGSKMEHQLQNQQWEIDPDSGRLTKHKGQRDDLTDSAIYARREAGHMVAEPEAEPERDTRSGADKPPPGDWREIVEQETLGADNPYADLPDEEFEFDAWW